MRAEAVYQQHVRNLGADSPRAHCLPDPPPYYHLAGLARIVQTPALLVIINEGVSNSSITRTIFTDGRQLPEEMNPTWLGYSVGRREGDTLIVTTAGFNDKTWLDFSGHPHSESLHLSGGNGFRVPAEMLAQYAGTYEVAPGHEAIVTGMANRWNCT